MKILGIVLQTILFGYLTAANASVRDEYLRRENEKEIYKNKSEMCFRNKDNKGLIVEYFWSRGSYQYFAVNEPYLELWEDCNLVIRYEFGKVYNYGNANRMELELFYADEPCIPGFKCSNYIIDIYIEEDGDIERRTLPAGNFADNKTIWRILSY